MESKKNKKASAEIDISKILHQCYVKLVREDLNILKEKFNNDNNFVRQLNKKSESIKCKICDKVYLSEKRLQNHNVAKHMIVYTSVNAKHQKRVSFSDEVIVHEMKEYHRCRKCPKIFEEYKLLKAHMKKMHKKRKCYICFYCNKDFVDRMFFKMHMKMHCDICGMLLSNKESLIRHKRTVCKIIKKYPCKCCNRIFFSFLGLKDHSYEHEGVKFVCDICKEQFHSKCLLLHHIQFLHCKKPPKALYNATQMGEDIMYACNSCDQHSCYKNIIEEHTIALPDLKNSLKTSYKDYYFCELCCEQFGTETKMLKHKWTHFLKTDNLIKTELECNKIKKCNDITLKDVYKVDEELPKFLQPKVLVTKLETLNRNEDKKEKNGNIIRNNATVLPTQFIDLTNLPETSNITQALNLNRTYSKAKIDPSTKKTLISKHQCMECGKYLSSKYSLDRHFYQLHQKSLEGDDEIWQNLQCDMCEEIFASPSLLKTHNCIRMPAPEMPFADARPEILFDNLHDFGTECNYTNGDNCNDPDNIISAPVVELTEYENLNIVVNDAGCVTLSSANTGYTFTVQEVPIEF